MKLSKKKIGFIFIPAITGVMLVTIIPCSMFCSSKPTPTPLPKVSHSFNIPEAIEEESTVRYFDDVVVDDIPDNSPMKVKITLDSENEIESQLSNNSFDKSGKSKFVSFRTPHISVSEKGEHHIITESLYYTLQDGIDKCIDSVSKDVFIVPPHIDPQPDPKASISIIGNGVSITIPKSTIKTVAHAEITSSVDPSKIDAKFLDDSNSEIAEWTPSIEFRENQLNIMLQPSDNAKSVDGRIALFYDEKEISDMKETMRFSTRIPNKQYGKMTYNNTSTAEDGAKVQIGEVSFTGVTTITPQYKLKIENPIGSSDWGYHIENHKDVWLHFPTGPGSAQLKIEMYIGDVCINPDDSPKDFATEKYPTDVQISKISPISGYSSTDSKIGTIQTTFEDKERMSLKLVDATTDVEISNWNIKLSNSDISVYFPEAEETINAKIIALWDNKRVLATSNSFTAESLGQKLPDMKVALTGNNNGNSGETATIADIESPWSADFSIKLIDDTTGKEPELWLAKLTSDNQRFDLVFPEGKLTLKAKIVVVWKGKTIYDSGSITFESLGFEDAKISNAHRGFIFRENPAAYTTIANVRAPLKMDQSKIALKIVPQQPTTSSDTDEWNFDRSPTATGFDVLASPKSSLKNGSEISFSIDVYYRDSIICSSTVMNCLLWAGQTIFEPTLRNTSCLDGESIKHAGSFFTNFPAIDNTQIKLVDERDAYANLWSLNFMNNRLTADKESDTNVLFSATAPKIDVPSHNLVNPKIQLSYFDALVCDPIQTSSNWINIKETPDALVYKIVDKDAPVSSPGIKLIQFTTKFDHDIDPSGNAIPFIFRFYNVDGKLISGIPADITRTNIYDKNRGEYMLTIHNKNPGGVFSQKVQVEILIGDKRFFKTETIQFSFE